MASDLYVPSSSIFLVSSISTKKVLFPSRILSEAPSLVNILSTGVNIKRSAGTKHPTCAKMTAKQVYLNKVDLPPMFGPVTNRARAGSSGVYKYVLFGTKGFSFPFCF